MALFEFRLPDIGEGVAEGEVVAWLVGPGDAVVEDQEMVEVMTDKATVIIGAPCSGRIVELRAQLGTRVPVGHVLVTIDRDAQPARKEASAEAVPNGHGRHGTNGNKALSRPPAPSTSSATVMAASAVGDIRESLPGTKFFTQSGARVQRPAANESYYSAKPLATPATRKLARDLGIDLRTVPPSGPGGRVTKNDLKGLAGESVHTLSEEPAPKHEGDRRRPFVGMRRRIAERLQHSVHKAAHFTFVEEVEVSALKALVERLKPKAGELGVKLPYLPFIVKAVTLALKKHPSLNSFLDERSNELVERAEFHIGIATATDQGLMVPVLQNADQKSVLQIAREVQRLSEGARAGTLSPRELTGSTFTITSLGKLGGLLATPILNYPEVGILGVHQVKERPVVKNGQIVIGQVMLLSLSFDHRIIDGHVGAQFAYDVISYLEAPELLLLELT